MTEPPTVADIACRAAALAPAFAELAPQCRELRRATDETVRLIREAGIHRIMQPARYGGHALGWDALCEVCDTLGNVGCTIGESCVACGVCMP